MTLIRLSLLSMLCYFNGYYDAVEMIWGEIRFELMEEATGPSKLTSRLSIIANVPIEDEGRAGKYGFSERSIRDTHLLGHCFKWFPIVMSIEIKRVPIWSGVPTWFTTTVVDHLGTLLWRHVIYTFTVPIWSGDPIRSTTTLPDHVGTALWRHKVKINRVPIWSGVPTWSTTTVVDHLGTSVWRHVIYTSRVPIWSGDPIRSTPTLADHVGTTVWRHVIKINGVPRWAGVPTWSTILCKSRLEILNNDFVEIKRLFIRILIQLVYHIRCV